MSSGTLRCPRCGFNLPPLARMCDRCEFEWHDVERIGDDMRLTLRPRRKEGA